MDCSQAIPELTSFDWVTRDNARRDGEFERVIFNIITLYPGL